MVEITINRELCRKDGLCAVVCPRGIFNQDEKGRFPTLNNIDSCMECGSCLSICSFDAITHSVYPTGSITPVQRESLPTYDQLLELLRSRRSQRAFRDRPVAREDIDKVLEATRFAPSEHNAQDTEIIVIQDKTLIQKITALTSEYYQRFAKMLGNPIGKMFFTLMYGKRVASAVVDFLPEMKGVADLYAAGKDYILRQAPVLLIFHADKVGGFPDINAQLAVQNTILAAETLGLACFFAGFVLRASWRSEKMCELMGLPETHKIYGILALGYSRVCFKKWPDRNPARVRWIGEGSPCLHLK